LVPLEDSEYVQMEAIEKIVPDTTTPAEKGEDTVMESSLVEKKDLNIANQ
jgi:hypothetical protein